MNATEVNIFEAARSRLFGVAYRLLGSASEAEDVVQDAFLRWDATERDRVRQPVAWLTKIVTNLCLNRLTSARARREEYIGPWLPEPVYTGEGALGPLETVEQRESVSMALLVLLERLTPPERAAFVLREAFGYSHREIAETLDVSEARGRQLYHRARKHVEDERGRFDASAEQTRDLVERFLTAASHGDLSGLEELLAAEVVAWSDGGGLVGAARLPILGLAKVARYFGSWFSNLTPQKLRRFGPRLTIHVIDVNARPAMLVRVDDAILGVVVPEVTGDRITAVHTAANPEKLRFLHAQLAGVDLGEPLAVVAADGDSRH